MPARTLGARLGDLDLKTKLLVMMLSLLVLSVFSLYLLHNASEQRLITKVREYTDDLSRAIEIAQEQPVVADEVTGRKLKPPPVLATLNAYAETLRQLGVKDVAITDAADEVQAATDPGIVGKKIDRHKKRGQEFVVKGVLGDQSVASEGQTLSTLRIPIVVNDTRVGFVHITRVLDDFSVISRSAFVSRLLATLAVFALGILLSLFLSWQFSRPLLGLTDAARRVARGDLQVTVPAGGGDEMGSLSNTFNEMVQRLRENKQLEERLHFAERSTAIGRLASAVAHEIRNPLNFLNLSLDHLKGQLAPDEAGKRADFLRILGNMKSEISRLNRLVGDFLSFGKPMRLDRRPCRVDQVVRAVAALVEHKARDQAIVLELEVEDALPELVADAELLKTCFLNLMINAVDAMPGGGSLHVAVRHGSLADAEAIATIVRDTGHGMNAEAVAAAFEPYFSTKETGVGLGLALTKKIVEDHGGRIRIESETGNGTQVEILLPLVRSELPLEDVQEAVVG